MNDLSFARYSPSLLMRGFLMRHFGAAGLQSFCFEGGTSHQMAGCFNKRTVCYLWARQNRVWLTLLEQGMKQFFPTRGITKTLFGYG